MRIEDFDQQLHDDVADLVAEGLIDKDSAAYGICQQGITDGPESMTALHRAVFESVVTPALEKLNRIRAANQIRPD